MTTHMNTDDLLDLIIDAADELGIQRHIDYLMKRLRPELPAAVSISDASQAVADFLAWTLKVSQFERDLHFDTDAFEQMHTDEGLRLEQWSTVLWVEEPGTLVVWLGNLEDQDMTHLGRSVFRN